MHSVVNSIAHAPSLRPPSPAGRRAGGEGPAPTERRSCKFTYMTLFNSNFSRFQALALLALALLCLPVHGIAANGVERYSGVMTLPIDLFTQEGAKVERRKYEIVVASDGTHWTLSFLSEGKERVVVKGEIAIGDLFNVPGMLPLVGTHYMRSSTVPLKTAQERQFSKTGLPQYAEQERDWKATLRVYRSFSEPVEVFFIFHVRNADGQLTRADFSLRSEALDGKR
jgi:hypothetical protein